MIKFVTDLGLEVPSVTKEKMEEIDRYVTEVTGPNLYQMMENTGQNLAKLAIDVLGEKWQKADILILAGYGRKGGGVICAARHLANRNARVYLCLANQERLSQVPAYQYKLYKYTTGKETLLHEIAEKTPDLIIDGLIGYSADGIVRGNILKLIQWANFVDAPILSLDIPSGVDATTGETAGESIQPTWTITLALPKTGLVPGKTGSLFLADIGIPELVFRKIGIQYQSPFDHRFRVPLFTK
jgi:NAD(P)H-hydrate epimerase